MIAPRRIAARLTAVTVALMTLVLFVSRAPAAAGAASTACSVPPATPHVFFITDREPVDDDGQLFSGERGLTKDFEAVVTRGILIGGTTRSAERVCTTDAAFLRALSGDFDKKRGRQVLIYLHGYYTTFRGAAGDALKLQQSMRFPGPVIVYSWPSKVTSRLTYFNDESNAGWATVHFRSMLATLMNAYPGMPISFAGHSLGARFVGDAIEFIHYAGCPKCLGRIVFFAPDVDGATLRGSLNVAGLCKGLPSTKPVHAAQVTLYVSNNDRALRQSQQIHGHQRAGQAGSELVVCGGVDTVDVGYYKSSDKYGHSYQVDAPIGDDIREAFAGVSPTAPKRHLEQVDRDGAVYYELR